MSHENKKQSADEIIAELMNERRAGKKETPAAPVTEPEEPDTEPAAEPDEESAAESIPEEAPADETVQADEPAEEPAEEMAEAPAEETASEAADEAEEPEEEPPVEEKVLSELRRLSRKPDMTAEEAEAQFEANTRAAAPVLRRNARKNERNWRKEAAAEQARLSGERAAVITAKWNVAICLVLFFGVAVGMLVLERPTMSEIENRMLATMPKWSMEDYLSGKYTSGVSEYYNDTVPFRSTFKTATQSFRGHLGLRGGPVIIGGAPVLENPQETLPPETTTETTVTTTALRPGADDVEVTTTKATTTTPAEDEKPEKEGEISNNILIVDNRGIMLFGGWEKMGEPYARYLNRYKQELPNVNMYSMVVPTVCSYYTPDDFQYLISSEKANIDWIAQCLDGVTPVDAYGALEKHTDEPIFMRTDHHWSGLGAFYAAEEFAKTARVPFARISEYEKHVKSGYVGTLYGYSNDITLKENPEDFIWYTPKANYRTTYYTNDLTSSFQSPYFVDINNLAVVSWYLVYMVGDDHLVHLQTDVHNGRNLCVMKDSYGNALIPWLTSSFENIYVMDMRYFKRNSIQFMKDYGVTDLLFCMNTFSANGGNATKIDDVRVQ